MRITKILIFLFALSQLTGCANSKTTSLDRSLQEYNNKQWAISEMWAKKSIENENEIHEAQFMVGLCEFRLQNIENAKGWFEKAATSTNTEVKGKATAMLGVIATSNGDSRKAELEFSKASKNLTGTDKIKATAFARGFTGTDIFTLQFGAYKKKENATNAIGQLSKSIHKAGLGSAWITKETSRAGRILFLVQAGHFKTRNDASLVREQYDLPQCTVTAAP